MGNLQYLYLLPFLDGKMALGIDSEVSWQVLSTNYTWLLEV